MDGIARMGYATLNCATCPTLWLYKVLCKLCRGLLASTSPLGLVLAAPLPLSAPRNCSAWLIWVDHFIPLSTVLAAARRGVTGFVLSPFTMSHVVWDTQKGNSKCKRKFKDFTSQTWSIILQAPGIVRYGGHGIHIAVVHLLLKGFTLWSFQIICSLLSGVWLHYYHHYCCYYFY